MAYYCVKCGRKLPDGAICPCRIRRGAPRQEDGRSVQSGVSFQNSVLDSLCATFRIFTFLYL